MPANSDYTRTFTLTPGLNTLVLDNCNYAPGKAVVTKLNGGAGILRVSFDDDPASVSEGVMIAPGEIEESIAINGMLQRVQQRGDVSGAQIDWDFTVWTDTAMDISVDLRGGQTVTAAFLASLGIVLAMSFTADTTSFTVDSTSTTYSADSTTA